MYTAIVEYDEELDCLVLPLPEEVLKELQWDVGTTLNWTDSGNGTITLTKK
jgi:hypothetical protein